MILCSVKILAFGNWLGIYHCVLYIYVLMNVYTQSYVVAAHVQNNCTELFLIILQPTVLTTDYCLDDRCG